MTGRHARLVAAVAAVLVVCGLSAERAAGGSPQAGFQPGDFTATSATDWWVLGTVRCGRTQCLAIRRTINGGRSFTAVPPPPSSTAQQANMGRLRFADMRDGYAFGPQLWSTHDGGRTWRQARIGFTDDLATADGYVYALVSDLGPTVLMRSPVASDRWRTLHVFGTTAPGGLSVEGRTVFVQRQGNVLISIDGGAHFRRGGRLPTGTNCQFDAAGSSGVVWALCFRAAADPGGELVRSADDGVTWTPVPLTGLPVGPVQALAAASPTVVVIAGYQRLYRTTDGGASWSPAAGLPDRFYATYLGFSDDSDGVAIGGVGSGRSFRTQLYSTFDAGASYQRVALR